MDSKRKFPIETWESYRFDHKKAGHSVPVILVQSGPKNIAELRKSIRNLDACIVFFTKRNLLVLRAFGETYDTTLANASEYERIETVVKNARLPEATDKVTFIYAIADAIESAPKATADFDNRGMFSTHYLRRRIFEDIRRDVDADVNNLPKNGSMTELLSALGWNSGPGAYFDGKVTILTTSQDDFSIRQDDSDTAPSYAAVSRLIASKWVILTNGAKWRLYTNLVSAQSTNYFEIVLNRPSVYRYLAAVFDAASYREQDGKADIDVFYNEGKNYAIGLEKDLASRIMKPDGLFLDIIKGVLDHDGRSLTETQLANAKQVSLKIMYRIWFLAYAESRNLLPVRDSKYSPISLQSIRNKLDRFENSPQEDSCWTALLELFKGIGTGSPEHNLPEYNGGLFRHDSAVDSISVRNKFATKALRGLLERGGEAVDYADLEVRHLGTIFESLMEFGVRQAKDDIMLLDDKGGVREVKTKQESAYSYKQGDLYLASKGGMLSRKTSASFYTPNEIVKFLVQQGLEPQLTKREDALVIDLEKYKRTSNNMDRQTCIDRLLDLQVCDPAMGSGHFLVEALNQITAWATRMLEKHPDHPLIADIEHDRQTIITEQESKGISIETGLLTHDVLLKRRVMKRCIFGVDINPMAAELTKLSLWLDSFAIGVPLTYMDHHIKSGDSTIGVWFDDLADPENRTLDDWVEYPNEPTKIINEISQSVDVTMDQMRSSRIKYEEYVKQMRQYRIMLDTITATKIVPNVIPKHARKDMQQYLRRIANAVSGTTKNIEPHLVKTIDTVCTKSDTYKFFHWEMEMMDAFTDQRRGFDLIVGNPPWDKVRTNKKEFFSMFDLAYRKKSAAEQKKTERRFAHKFQEYKLRLDEKKQFYKRYGGMGENRDFDLWRIVTERAVRLLAPGGVFSMLIPSAITNSRSATELRKYILNLNILTLCVFENSQKIFPIHSSQRFALVSFQNAKGLDKFDAAFYLHSLDILNNISGRLVKLSKKYIHELSPEMSIIFETSGEIDYQILLKIHRMHPRLRDMLGWSVDLGRELNMGERKDKKLLTASGGWPVIESKDFHQHIHNFSISKYRADTEKTLARVSTIRKFCGQSGRIHQNPRLVYRSISSSTNTRTMISSIVPQSVFTTIGAYMAIPRIGIFEINSDYHRLNAYLCGVFNSTTYDFFIRLKVDKNVETYQIYDTPIPENFTGYVAERIAKLSAILALAEFWHEDMADAFSLTQQSVGELTLGRRIEIVAEIDALTALHYGLSRDEYQHILSGFKYDRTQFTNAQLSSRVEYQKMRKPDRDKHMRIFYGHVYRRVLFYYDRRAGTIQMMKDE